jgi:hypothetical protein
MFYSIVFVLALWFVGGWTEDNILTDSCERSASHLQKERESEDQTESEEFQPHQCYVIILKKLIKFIVI